MLFQRRKWCEKRFFRVEQSQRRESLLAKRSTAMPRAKMLRVDLMTACIETKYGFGL